MNGWVYWASLWEHSEGLLRGPRVTPIQLNPHNTPHRGWWLCGSCTVDRTPTLLTILCLCTGHSSICRDHLQPGNGPGQNNAGIPAEGPAPWNTPPILLSHTGSSTTQACLAWYWTFCCHGYQVIVISDLRCWWNWSCYSHRKSLLQHYHRVKFKNLEQ